MLFFREKGKLSDVLKSKSEEIEAYLSEIEVRLYPKSIYFDLFFGEEDDV